MCMHWSTNGKTCAFCGEPIPDVIEAKTIEIAAGKIQGEVISSEPSPVNEILLEAAIEFCTTLILKRSTLFKLIQQSTTIGQEVSRLKSLIRLNLLSWRNKRKKFGKDSKIIR